jgi:hypothetical protein
MTPKAIFGPSRAPRSTYVHKYYQGHINLLLTTPTMPCAATTRLRPHVLYLDPAVRRDYSSPAARTLRQPRCAPRLLVSGCISYAVLCDYSLLGCTALRQPSCTPWVVVSRLQRLYINYAARPGASARRAVRHTARRAARRRLLRLAQARRRLLRLRRTSGCLSTSCGSSRRLSSTTPPRAGSSSTTSAPLRVRVPRHVARFVTRLVAPLVVDYSASRRLVVDYFVFAARPGASARRATCHGVRRRLLRAPQLPLAVTLALLQSRCASRLLVSRQHWLYFEYAARRQDVIFRSHRVDHSSRLVFQTSRERQSHPQQLVGINSD